jgi:hypothetical protein
MKPVASTSSQSHMLGYHFILHAGGARIIERLEVVAAAESNKQSRTTIDRASRTSTRPIVNQWSNNHEERSQNQE